MNNELPKLYKTTGTGKTQTWQIFVDGADTYAKFGPAGGTIQTSARETATPKNAGRANATTAEEQAVLDAESKWRKKLASGYVRTMGEIAAGTVDASIQGGIFPMLAKSYRKDGHKIAFPAYAQPKLDGHRCVAVVDGQGKCTLWTRKRKPYGSVPHVVRAVEALGLKDVVLDGELYAHSFRDRFEQLAHLVRQGEPEPGHPELEIEYHVFDLQAPDGFARRNERLDALLADARPPLVRVRTRRVDGEAALMAAFEEYRALGYEGAMVRNAEGAYESHPTHRSGDLQKIKEFDDAEWPIVGIKEGRGKLAGHAIFTCRTQDGAEFDVKLAGDTAALKGFYENPGLAIGRLLTVQYQGLTGKSGVPRFPVGLRIRDDAA
jgi:ATP-dependent DNA ligase